jgi:hypothetical protein
MSDVGAVSQALEHEVLGELRRQGIVVWLDKDASYTPFADGLAARHARGEFPFPVVGFRGSFLELLFKLEPYGSGLDRQPLLIHMPGFNEESVRKTPVLEVYEAGVRYRKGLDTLIREAATARVAPAEVEKFVATQPTLEAADAWLSSAVTQSTFGLAAVLDQFGPKILAEALANPASIVPRVTAPEEIATLQNYIHKLTGMDEAWEAQYPDRPTAKPLDRVLHGLGGWALSVEYVHDLQRPSPRAELARLRSLSAPLVKACRDMAGQLRRDSPDAYARVADEAEGLHVAELRAMAPEDLGQIDTFREEENRILTGAVEALRVGEWAKARAWCDARQGDKSFWLQRDQLRRWAWMLVGEAADFGDTLARHPRPFSGARSLDDAAERYAATAFEVDRAHRRFEQRRLALLESRLPHYGALREVATELRRSHRAWADQLARDFAGLCKEYGFLPSSELRQRNVYEQVVHPLTLANEKVAVFLIDAFRYEMATELVEELDGSGTSVSLKPRLAELPTITSVGMNVLAPVAQNERLSVAGIFQGFKTGEATVRTPEQRAGAMGRRSAGKPALLLKLAEVCEASTPDLTRKVKAHQLVVVHSKEIDDAGEANIGIPTFESTLRQIKAAWHHLQLAGVKNCVFTADHGFLLQDETTEVRPFGTKRDPSRRHVLDDHARAESGMVNVPVSSLLYDGLPGYLLLRDDTAVFATGNPGASFVHGGNSPQERVIPVLTVTRKRAEAAGLLEYVTDVEVLPAALGLHHVHVRVRDSKTTLGFVGARQIDLAIRVPEREAVRVIVREPVTQGAGRLQVLVGDAWTEVFFGLEGPNDERVRIEIHHPDKIENVRSAVPDAWYAVSGTSTLKTPSLAPPPAAPVGWADTIADEGIRRVFLHIEKHGRVTETEVTGMLGSPRAFRRFSLEFEDHLAKLPFRVSIESGDGGKRYVREGEK